jgi:hypothetical protein
MATKLFLRNTNTAEPNVDLSVIGVDTVVDMLTTAGAGVTTFSVNTAAGGTEIIFDVLAGTVAWISGRAPAGGFTLTSTDISAWMRESNMNANCGGRYRVFRYRPGSPPTLTELGGGPFNDGVEFSTSITEMLWTGNVTDTAFAEDDRIVLKIYITNVGTMGGGFSCDLQLNAADGNTGDSFFNIAETVTFKAEDVAPDPTRGRVSWTEFELPLAPTRGRISWTELETPLAPTRGRISWTELEIPLAPTRGRVSWTELELPIAPTRGRVSWTELETPNAPADPTRGQISWAEFEVPDLQPTRGRISWLEFEAPTVQTRARISWTELEIPGAPTRGRVSWTEFQTPDVGGGGDGAGAQGVILRRRRR